MIKRDRILKPNDFLFKKILALLLIIVFFIYTNCFQHRIRMRYQRSLFACSAEYIQGSSSIPIGKGGFLVLYEKSLQYEYKAFTLQIPYEDILDVKYSKNIKNIITKFPEPNYGYYEKQDWGGMSFSQWLILWGVGALSAIIVLVILKVSESYTYMTITYEMDGQTEWNTFKIRSSDINKLMPILNEKIDIY